MCPQLAQDDDGFEIRSFGSALEEEEGLAGTEAETHVAEDGRDLSPVPPKPVPSAPRQRESLDGETIFAVGEDADKWSEDDDENENENENEDEDESPRNSGERERLTGKD
jgi:hypothetical protein